MLCGATLDGRGRATAAAREAYMYRGPYGIVGVILVVILILILLRLLGLF